MWFLRAIDWFWLRGWLINKRAICTGTARLFRNFRKATNKIGRTNRKAKSVYCAWICTFHVYTLAWGVWICVCICESSRQSTFTRDFDMKCMCELRIHMSTCIPGKRGKWRVWKCECTGWQRCTECLISCRSLFAKEALIMGLFFAEIGL